MPIVDGMQVNAANTNTQLLDAVSDDFSIGKLGQQNVASGFFVQSFQQYLNNIAQVIGLDYTANYTAEADTTGRNYGSVSGTVPNGTTTKAAIKTLSDKFAGSITGGGGHTHSGVDGQGPKLKWEESLDGVRSGIVPLITGTDAITVEFSSPLDTTVYAPVFSVGNDVDSDPIFLQGIVFSRAVDGFMVRFNAMPDSLNYYLSYVAGKSL